MTTSEVWKILHSIPDPEIPVISIVELGIIRDVQVDNENVIVKITPTYSGCPAMDQIETRLKKMWLQISKRQAFSISK
jgi:ring-1,2-phenylacetyl-CoA epoxidase subunit PaaD